MQQLQLYASFWMNYCCCRPSPQLSLYCVTISTIHSTIQQYIRLLCTICLCYIFVLIFLLFFGVYLVSLHCCIRLVLSRQFMSSVWLATCHSVSPVLPAECLTPPILLIPTEVCAQNCLIVHPPDWSANNS